jgi:hypothetical protein
LLCLVEERYFVGLQDRFDEFMRELEQRYGWRLGEARGKVGRHRPRLEDVPRDAADAIRAYNWLDDELYRFCAGLVDARRPTLEVWARS